jgi:protein-tyrosine phosphatase
LGLYGDKTEKAVLQFLELNLIHLIGSDSHGPHSLSWRLRDAVAKAEIVVSKEQAEALVEENPQAVVDNKELPFLLQAINPKKGERPFSIRIPKIFKGRH